MRKMAQHVFINYMTIFKLFEIEIRLLDSLFQVEGKFRSKFQHLSCDASRSPQGHSGTIRKSRGRML